MRHAALFGLSSLLLSALFFASSGPLAKVLYEIGWTPGSVALLRLTGATVLLALPTLVSLRGKWGQLRKHWVSVVVYGIVAMAGVQIFFFLSLEHVTVAVGILIEMMGAPILIVLWLWIRTGRFPGAIICVGILVCVLGVVLVLDLRGSQLNWLGVALALAAAACMAGYFVLSSSQSIRLPPLAFTGLGMAVGAIVALITVATGITPARFEFAAADFAGFRVSWLVPAVALILITAGAYWFGLIGLRHLGPTLGSFTNLLEIPFATVMAWLMLGEALSGWQLLGGLIMVLGIVLVKVDDLRSARGSTPVT
ncbi:MAG: EamA family transporter [Galactobacter sp.]